MPDHSPQDRLTGTLLDHRYRIQRRLATGGTASVYVGLDERLDRHVALKIIHPHFADDPKFVERAQREAKAAARLHHPNVVAVLDQGQTSDGVVYLVLEYVDGPTLRHVIARESPMTARRTLDLLIPVLRGLAQAHRSGMVHRDIKPENVLLTTGGDVKVADFGLMRAVDEHTSTSTILGTVAYAAPELVGHEPVDQRCDVYAVGIMTYEMLTGSRPYTAPHCRWRTRTSAGTSPRRVALPPVFRTAWTSSCCAVPPATRTLDPPTPQPSWIWPSPFIGRCRP
ncbi:protein kinase domain-containing protein [Kocuria atrinae]|uniref:protein kinase domain-containing protein n=1 Tax=Kocuria atrinae TaxID=592377 RepID=UPI0003023E06|nr:protein kinase [Kocuria atrinae]